MLYRINNAKNNLETNMFNELTKEMENGAIDFLKERIVSIVDGVTLDDSTGNTMWGTDSDGAYYKMFYRNKILLVQRPEVNTKNKCYNLAWKFQTLEGVQQTIPSTYATNDLADIISDILTIKGLYIEFDPFLPDDKRSTINVYMPLSSYTHNAVGYLFMLLGSPISKGYIDTEDFIIHERKITELKSQRVFTIRLHVRETIVHELHKVRHDNLFDKLACLDEPQLNILYDIWESMSSSVDENKFSNVMKELCSDTSNYFTTGEEVSNEKVGIIAKDLAPWAYMKEEDIENIVRFYVEYLR
jgi:hypothetical protein